MATLFTRIINGEIPCYKIAENDLFIAFLDILPVAKGHALVVPKKEIDYIFDLPNEELQALNIFAKEVARKIQSVIPCKKIGISVIGLEVPHAHMHLIPINNIHDMNFEKERLKFTAEEYTELAQKISNA
ncbi:MAG: HIT family protein [Flavobacteriales bacterium]|jgi:histidine triad (HIT) family protein|nr:HIT family protein [Flavobacteriales bacterium]MDP4717782.1 HIT family protein [Flavobacteriales bacterium]MDP4731907.1 HIT family protein [Flavobacteriales bacterium]MDP4818451.1 HIT family protein [Flavobacteriales bacterium]MDP4951948.1 HIT family protein [Flavobacteriales bacterium]